MIVKEGTVTITKDEILATGFTIEKSLSLKNAQQEIYKRIKKRIIEHKLQNNS